MPASLWENAGRYLADQSRRSGDLAIRDIEPAVAVARIEKAAVGVPELVDTIMRRAGASRRVGRRRLGVRCEGMSRPGGAAAENMAG
jgi:hypothetical protein